MPRTNTRSTVASTAGAADGTGGSFVADPPAGRVGHSAAAARTSSGMSKLAQTFWTSSWSSSASIRRSTLLASPSSVTGDGGGRHHGQLGRLDRHARPPRAPSRTAIRSVGAAVDHPAVAVRRVRSSAPASMATSMSSSSSGDRGSPIDALALELPRHRAGLGHRAAVAGEELRDLGAGAVAVVGQRLDDDGHARRGVALVGRPARSARPRARPCRA